MRTTYFVLIAAICALLPLLALVAYVVRETNPRSFRLSVAFARAFSFSVELESRVRDAPEVTPDSFPDGARRGHERDTKLTESSSSAC